MDAKQLAVYEEFARNIPGFLPSNDLSQPTGFLAQPMKVNGAHRVTVTPPVAPSDCASAVFSRPTVLTCYCDVFQQQQAWATDDVAQIYDKCIADLEQHLHAVTPGLAINPLNQALRSLVEAVVLARNSRDGIAALGLLQKVRPFGGGAARGSSVLALPI